MDKIKIIGCGSLLMGDDAIGCIIARKLKSLKLPEHVTVIEAGTPGVDLLNMINPDERVIIIDAVITNEVEEGTLRVFTEDALPKPAQMPLSAHQIAIPEAIALGRKIQPELMPKSIEVWGIEIKQLIINKEGLSEKVEAAVPVVVEKVVNELF
jgi:hydrogenase maturation protease